MAPHRKTHTVSKDWRLEICVKIAFFSVILWQPLLYLKLLQTLIIISKPRPNINNNYINFPQLMCHDAASVLELTMGQYAVTFKTIVTNIITD